MKPSQMLTEVGQSPWLDLIGRKLIQSGEVIRVSLEDGIRGVTANPAIFEKAIVESDEYDGELSRLIEAGRTPMEIYETLAVGDVFFFSSRRRHTRFDCDWSSDVCSSD